MSTNIYDDIAPLYDHQVEAAIADLLVDPGFQHAVRYIMPQIDWAEFSAVMTRYKVKHDFQSEMIYNTVWMLARKSTTSLKGDGWDKIKRDRQYLFLTNHRDIVLDAGFLNILRHEQGLDTTEIAIGDNLLIHPWIEKLVKMNKSFIVRRGLGIREQLISSKHMADYIHYAIAEKGESVWMAQREGRAKDSNDRTQDSILKMLTLGARGSFVECLQELNIMPVSISYEYDPCDYLKAKEFQLKRDNPEYKKSQRDDLLNMEIGILGFKGNVLFRFGDCINDQLNTIVATDRRGQIEEVVKMIDKMIHSNYEFHTANYVAYDLLNESSRFADKYTSDDITKFEEYIKKQLAKIDLDYIDFDFCRHKMLIMYSNTLKNHLVAIEQ